MFMHLRHCERELHIVAQIGYVHAKDVDLAKFSAKTTEISDEEQSQPQTKTLYHMAESFLKTLRSLEISQ